MAHDEDIDQIDMFAGLEPELEPEPDDNPPYTHEEIVELAEADLDSMAQPFLPNEDRLEPALLELDSLYSGRPPENPRFDPVAVNEYLPTGYKEQLEEEAERLTAETNLPADLVADQLADEGFHKHDFMGPGDTCSQCAPEEPAPLAVEPAFDRPMTVEELQEAAQRALAVLEEEKRLKKIAKYRERASVGADLRHPVNTHLYTQDRMIEGGCGQESCMMCTGEACRFCGAGCWDDTVKDCQHDIGTRHQWDEAKIEYRKQLLNQELTEKGMTSEIRRQEMLDKIFDGEPMRNGSAPCFKCHKTIAMGSLAIITSRGSYHLACPPTGEELDERAAIESQDSEVDDNKPLTEEDIPF